MSELNKDINLESVEVADGYFELSKLSSDLSNLGRIATRIAMKTVGQSNEVDNNVLFSKYYKDSINGLNEFIRKYNIKIDI